MGPEDTQLRRLKAWLESDGFTVTTTRQPDVPGGRAHPCLLLDSRTESLDSLAELG